MTLYEYRNDTFRGKRAENKIKQSNIVYNLVVFAREAREKWSFLCLKCLMAVFYQIKDEYRIVTNS